jgi:hypothetical protein
VSSSASAPGQTGVTATVGASIASTVAAEAATSPAVETMVGEPTPPIADAAHLPATVTALAAQNPETTPLMMLITPQGRGDQPLTPRPTPQHTLEDLTAKVNTISR